MTVLQTVGLSHSEILGSKIICIYPRLIAAYHVLHRLREPRHPPCALFYFLRIFIADCSETKTVAHTFSCCYFFNLQFCLYQYVKDRWLREKLKVKNPLAFLLPCEKPGLEPSCMPALRLHYSSIFSKTVRQEAREKESKPFADLNLNARRSSFF